MSNCICKRIKDCIWLFHDWSSCNILYITTFSTLFLRNICYVSCHLSQIMQVFCMLCFQIYLIRFFLSYSIKGFHIKFVVNFLEYSILFCCHTKMELSSLVYYDWFLLFPIIRDHLPFFYFILLQKYWTKSTKYKLTNFTNYGLNYYFNHFFKMYFSKFQFLLVSVGTNNKPNFIIE